MTDETVKETIKLTDETANGLETIDRRNSYWLQTKWTWTGTVLEISTVWKKGKNCIFNRVYYRKYPNIIENIQIL